MEKHNQQSLYVPSFESDACGIGLVAQLEKKYSHQLVSDALTMLENMEHRGACGCDPESGDGAGILIHVPDNLFRQAKLGFDLPEPGQYGVGCFFLPKGQDFEAITRIIQDCATELSLTFIGMREVPVSSSILGSASSSNEPDIYHFFFSSEKGWSGKYLDRHLHLLRKYATHQVTKTFPQHKDDFYIPSLSCRTLVYKGQLTSNQVRKYFKDLEDHSLESAVALVHSRFSTNTIPRWRLAQPFRMIAHNGEINTIEGNKNWWSAKEKTIESPIYSAEELAKMFPLFNL